MYCKKCHYSLRQLHSTKCPECGTRFSPEDPSSYLTDLSQSIWGRRLKAAFAANLLCGIMSFISVAIVPIQSSTPFYDAIWAAVVLGSMGLFLASCLLLTAVAVLMISLGYASSVHPGIVVWLCVIDFGTIAFILGLLNFLFP